MKNGIFAIYDVKAERFLAPYTAVNAMVAMRMFADQVRNPESIFARYPQDFSLRQIGLYDEEKGSVESINMQDLGLAVQFVESELRAVE